MSLSVGSVFSGIGLLDLGLHLAGLEHRWLCEVDPWRRSILGQRFPGAPVIEDIRAVGSVRCERVDVIAGGFPCKGASTAGKREGFGHPETVLWREMFRAVCELEPRFVVVENVANLLAVGDGAVWGEVVGDLASLGFDIEWDCVPAGAVGAPHLRDRIFAVASYAAGGGGPAAAYAGQFAGLGGNTEPGRVPTADPADLGSERPGGTRNGRKGSADGGSSSSDDARDAEGGAGTPAWSDGQRTGAGSHVIANPAGEDRDVEVDWGKYDLAIRRWEAVHGPAPEPLVCGVDDRGAARVERSRLSALGDGVQVQVGRIVGEYLMSLEGQ